MSNISTDYSGGYVSARGDYDLASGELRRALGIYYKKGDPHPWKMRGRTAFGTVLADNRIKGLAVCTSDDGNDRVIAYAGTAFYGATPGVTGTFASLVSGLDARGEELTAAPQGDRWYLGNGYDRNKKLKPDGTIVDAGMQTPAVALVAVAASTVGVVAYPTANAGGFLNAALAYDGDDATYASATLSAPGTVSHVWSAWAPDATAGRSIEIRWWLSGLPISGDAGDVDRIVGSGGTTSAGYEARVKLEKSEDGGSVWTTIQDTVYTKVPSGVQTNAVNITANSNLLLFRATLTYVSGTNAATLRVHATKTKVGSSASNFSTVDGVSYAYTEYDETEDIESPPSEITGLVDLASQNQVTLTRGAAVNATATHWRIYRIPDEAEQTQSNLGRIATVPIGQSTYTDTFDIAAGRQSSPIVALYSIGTVPFPRDTQGPAFVHMFVVDGSVCGLSLDRPRELRYADEGRPESWPEFYIITAFSLPENDQLQCGVGLGRTGILFARGAVLAFDGLPRVVENQYEAGKARPIAGHPGCVGRKAAAKYSLGNDGEGRAAWVSPMGVYSTNGETCSIISLDLDWETEVPQAYLESASLEWDQQNLILWFDFDTDGDGQNDRRVPIHMSPTHQKPSGQPKWGQPTPYAASCTASAVIANVYRRYSGHPSNGVVYLDDSGGVDAATGDAMRFGVKTGKIRAGREDLAVKKVSVQHSDWGTDQSATITVVLGRDAANRSQTVSKSLGLAGDRATEVGVGRAGEWITVEIEHSSDAAGRIGGVDMEVTRQGRSGASRTWVSSPATP